MQISVRKMTKAAGVVCAATGIVALSALVASSAAVGAVIEGFKSAGDAMKKILTEEAEKKDADNLSEKQYIGGEENVRIQVEKSK